ncbi:MAG: holo-ACP synthase [Deltaproteobacteria bacterium]|nr:holo-ACP synthase [Deltaproteobacteria bacterium]
MIAGTGIDLVAIGAFAAQLADRASRFAAATFTDAERAYCESAASKQPAQHLAARYAAKEAAVKALDEACGRAQLDHPALPLTDIEVIRDARGRPALMLHGAARALAERLHVDRAFLSLSHDGDYATAMVTLETLTAR